MNKKLLAAFIITFSALAFLQFGGRIGQQGGRMRQGGGFEPNGQTGGRCLVPGYRGTGEEDLPTPRDIDRNAFIYARLRYHTRPWRGETSEVPWHHDYPDGDTMLPTALSRLTKTYTTPDSYQIVDIDSEELFQYPFAYISEPGFLNLLPGDVKNLREYLDRGGFLLLDDFRGDDFDDSQFVNMEEQLRKIYPDRELEPVSLTHPIFHTVFDVNPYELLPPYRMYNSGEPQFLAISDPKGNIQIMVDFNTDISEYWQALDVGQCSLHESAQAVELGVNYAVYAMTH